MLVLFLATNPASAAALSWVSPSTGYALVGDTVEVALAFDGLGGTPGNAVSYFNFNIGYDTSAFQFIGGSFGSNGYNPLDLSEATPMEFTSDIVDLGGLINLFALSGNSQGVLDTLQPSDFIGLTLHFIALAVDPAASITLDVTDPAFYVGSSDNYAPLPVSMASPSLNLPVYASAPPPIGVVPEPAMATLLMIGLMGLVRQRRSRRISSFDCMH
ncbi:hypothetical protein Z042_14725 [Chania multitudinisentens RB-25]|uniref:Cohesin domain-containing protein n=2 Tax=Chania TaxID=1745211 RepID=W0LGF3_9GAMM|nr:PEP-CTERM domain protein [Chania multitudinisentens]AHG22826.1 hypothetical protein Z042_14725 [Chania multitudinisentens RB-25]